VAQSHMRMGYHRYINKNKLWPNNSNAQSSNTSCMSRWRMLFLAHTVDYSPDTLNNALDYWMIGLTDKRTKVSGKI